MSLITLRCPSCGAIVQLSSGRIEGFCEYCGNPVRYQMTDAEKLSNEKDREYASTVNAAVASMRHGEYKMAIDYADKALAVRPGTAVPNVIKGLCCMPKDFKKGKSFFEIGRSTWDANSTKGLTESIYDEILSAFASSYLDEKDADLRRMIETIRGSDASDIENVRSYEYRKRLDDYYTIPDIKDAFTGMSSECMDQLERDFRFSGQLSGENWMIIRRFYKECIYRAVSTSFVNPGLSSRSFRLVDAFCHDLDLKWSSVFKTGVEGSKDELKLYCKNSEVIHKWLKSKV